MTTEQKIALERELKKFRKRLGNKTFEQCLTKSRWFELGVALTIKKGQATRVLIGENIVYELDSHDILINLIDLTNEAVIKSKKYSFNFIRRLKKLYKIKHNSISIYNQYKI